MSCFHLSVTLTEQTSCRLSTILTVATLIATSYESVFRADYEPDQGLVHHEDLIREHVKMLAKVKSEPEMDLESVLTGNSATIKKEAC